MDDSVAAQKDILFSVFAVGGLLIACVLLFIALSYLLLDKSPQQNLQNWAKRKDGHYYWPLGIGGVLLLLKPLWQRIFPSWSVERIAGLSLSEQAVSECGCLEIFIQERQTVILQTRTGKHSPLLWYAKVALGIPPIRHFLISPQQNQFSLSTHKEKVLGITQYYALGWGTFTTEDATFNQNMRVQGQPEYEIHAYLTAKRRAVILELAAQYPSFYIDRGYACIQAHPGSEGDPVERLIMGIQDICLNYPSLFA